MDKFEYMLKNDGRLKTSPIKDQYSDTISNQLAESANRRRKEEEERKKREEEERKRRLKLDAETQAIKTLATENSGRGFDEVSSPTTRAMDNLPQSNSRQAYKKWYEGEDVRKYKDYSNGLGEDIRNTIEYSRAAGLKDDEIKNSLIPQEDNTIEQRLEEIGSKLKPGKESWGQTMQEGWYEKELQDMLSKETLRQMNGLPNKADVIQKWMADNPELSISEDANILDKGIRFLAEGTRQQVDSYSAASKNWESWAMAGAIVVGASLLAPVTGGGSLLVGGTLLGNSVLALGSLGALKLGMSYGSMKHMAELETADKYNQYIEEGIHPEIAKTQAATVGAFNGIVEFMQIDSAFSTIPGVTNLLDNGKKVAGKEFTKQLTKVAANYGVDLLGNAAEESIQEATGLMGLELSKYLENAPNPNTLGGLKTLAKTFDNEDYRQRVLQSGVDALQSMWLSPIVSSGIRQGASRGVNATLTKAQAKKVNGYYTQDEKFTQAYLDEQKNMLLTDKEENQIDLIIKDYNETRDKQSLAYLMTADQVLESIAQREDTSNQDKELIQKNKEKINNIISQAMYDAKDENSDIEYKAANNQDIESEITSTDFEREIYTPTFNEYAIERFNDAKDAGVLETIKEELIKGTSKSEISNKITKALPRKTRNPLDVATMINAVESVQKEVNAQKVMNNLHNYDLIKDYKPTEVVEETQTEIEATEEPQAEVKGVSNTIVQTDIESPTESLVEPTNNIEVELGTDEVETDTNEETSSKFPTSNVVKVPVSKIHVDADRFQFRYSGTTKKLDGATFNQDLSSPLMLWEDDYGDLYVVNGHHRLRLAEQSGTQEVEAKIYTSQEYSDTAIRALGAIVNIAENNAEAIDVAKVLRDSTITTDELKQYVSPRSKVMRDGIALSNLNDWIFTQVATSKIPTDIGVVIGNELPGDKAGQNQIVKAIDKLQLQGKDITASILTEMVAEVKGTAQETFTEQTLFGEETFTKSVQYERASLVEYVKGQLKSKKSLLKSVTKEKNASMLESLGNKIAADENTEQLEQSELTLLLLDKTLNYQGTKVNKLFNDLALEYSQAEPKDRAAIKRKALDELISLMEGGNLLGENETTKSKRKASSIIRAIQDSNSDGERGQESSYDSEQIITEEQEEIAGQEALFALREQPQVEIVADDDVKNTRAYKSTIKIVEALQKNVFFNGLKVNYSNKSGKIVFDSKKELKERGYEHYEVGKTYYIYGAYDNRTREITLNSEAARDTILEETIHDIQSRIQEINPELGVTIQAWENEVREQAAALGYEIPGGYELLAQALVFSELGYASSNKEIAELIAVDDEIVVGMKAILGRDVLKEGQGLVESETAKKDRELKGMYENYAKRIFTQDGFLDNLLEAEENRKTEIRAELANARAATYYHPSNGQYVIVSPSTKGAKYQVTTFSPKFGPISDGQYDTIDEIADRLVEDKFYYKANEIHYQLKQFTRGVVDELYGIAISRGYRADNNTTTNRERISFQLNDTQIIEAYHDAQIGNFSAQDFDELILHNNELEDRVKQTIIGRIRDAIDNGYDVPNSEVRIGQYLNRFYNIAMPTIKGKRLDLRIKGNKVELGVSGFQLDGEREFYEYDAYNTLEEAISDYKGNLFLLEETDLDKALYKIVEKDFSYTVEMLRASKGITKVNAKRQVFNDIKSDYQEFRDNIETYRHKGLNYNFDMKPHYAISYQLKPLLNVGYHAGDLGKAEGYFNIASGSRSTGHFGTGTYFVGNKDAINIGNYKERPQHEISFDGYNLFKPTSSWDARNLHEALKFINYNSRITDLLKMIDNDEVQEELDKWSELYYEVEEGLSEERKYELATLIENHPFLTRRDLSNAEDKSNGDFGEYLGWIVNYMENNVNSYNGYVKDVEYDYEDFKRNLNAIPGITVDEALSMLDEIAAEVKAELGDSWFFSKEAQKADSISTRFMKKLGYEGIDVRHIREFDNTNYGSVIYDLKEANEINLQLKAATNTQEFKNWFKDSKVVDEEGNPLVVYHGTPSRFEIFDINKVGDRNANYGKGFYFTSDLTTATDYALDLENNVEYQEAKKIAREKADIHESYDFWELRRQGKLDNATAEDMENYRKLREIAWEDYLVAKRNREKVLEKFYQNRENGIYEDRGNIISSYVSLQNPYIVDAEGANYDKINPLVWEMVDANNWRANYDGIIIKNVTDAVSAANLYPIDVYIAFNPTQIKSIYNNGIFNEYDPNINYQLKESSPIVDVHGFYSNLENVLNDKMGKRAKASEIMNMLTKNGVKPEEMEWFEIASFLEGKDFVYKNELLDHMREKSIEFTTKDMGNEFESYTLDGGDNYRFNAYTYKNNPGTPFIYQPHFGSVQNVIGHTRYKDRVGANGEKVLLIEELQSDWHQKGRQEGYNNNHTRVQEIETKLAVLMDEAKELSREMQPLTEALEKKYWELVDEANEGKININYPAEDIRHATLQAEITPLEDRIAEIREERKVLREELYNLEKATPDAPLKESITDFLIKTAIKDAVEGGYDYIAWTTGTQQADRYSMRKVIDQLEVLVNPSNNTYEVYAKKGDVTQLHQEGMSEQELADTFGKEMANNIVNDAKPIINNFSDVNEPVQLKTYEGLDLETGGEFHKKLYDNYVPRMLKKYGKKWGINLEEIALRNNIEDLEKYQNKLSFYNEYQLLRKAREFGISTSRYENALEKLQNTRTYEAELEYEELANEEMGLIREEIVEAMVERDMQDILHQPSIPVTPQMIEDVMTQGQPLFQLKDVPQTNGDLLAIHNLSEEQLKNTIKLGGFPFPSIAVVNKEYEHSRYGDISVLFDKDTINPRLNRKNKVYGGDAWTPTFPTINKKISKKAADALYERINNIVPADIRREYRLSLDEDNLDDGINRAGNFVDAYKYNSAMKYAYLKEQGIDIEMPTKEKQYSHEADLLDILKDKYPVFSNEKYIDFNEAEKIKNDVISDLNSFYGVDLYNSDIFGFSQMSRLGENVYEFSKRGRETVIDYYELKSILDKQINQEGFEKWLNDISSRIIEKEGIRNNADYFTPSGNRRKWESLHMEATLDNIVKIMSGKAEKGSDTMFPSFSIFAATVTDNFGSIEEIRQSSDRLISLDEDSYSEISNQYSEKYMEIIGEMAIPSEPDQFMAMDTIGEAIIESVSKSITKQGIKKVLDSYYGLKYEDSTVDKIIELVKLVKTMPTEYFEAKPQRAVYLNEIAAVIAPDTLSPEVEQMLKDNGINLIEKYNPGEDRQVAIDRVLRQNDVSFQLKAADTTTKQFKNWFRNSKVVDEEGKPLVVYHGSPNTFTEFRPSTAPGWGKGIYFTDNAENATEYAYSKEGIKPLYEVYLSIDNPYTDETRLSDGDIENTRAYKERQNAVPMVDGEYDYEIDARELFGEDGEFANDVIRELGYDGIIYEDSNNIEGKEIVVFSPTQIKSVYNYGAWDVNDANIYYQLKEEPDTRERSWGQTVRDAELTEPWLTELLTSNKFMYEVKHNEDTLIAAAQLLDTKGEMYVEARLLSDLDNDAVLMAASQILTYKYMESGEQDRAMAMLDKTAEKATSLGQAIQILSVWGRQTPEGMLRYTSQAFRKAITDRDRQMVGNKTRQLTEDFNNINRQAIKDIDLVDIVKQVGQMTPEELASRDIANKGGILPEGGFTPEMLQPFTNTIDDGMRDRIIDTINKHYEDGKGRLVDKLQDLGLNEAQARTITNYTKKQIKTLTKADKQAKVDSELGKKGYERKGLVDDILDTASEGVIDETRLRNLIGEKEGLPVLSKELVDYIYQQGQYINSLPQGRQRDIETAKIMKTISDQMPVSFWTKVNTIQTIAQLLNFKTTIRNLVGNDMFRRLDTFTLNFFGTPIDAVLAKATGNSRSMLFRPIKANQVQKLGYKEGWRLGLEDALLGINTSDEGTQYELRRNRVFTTGPLAQAEMVMDIALRATDKAAVAASFRDSLAEQMEIAGVDTATDEMTENAMIIALYRTFQDDSTLAGMFRTLKKGMNKIGSKDGQFGLGDLILKYPKTPANILGRAIDYSPVGVVATALKLARDTSPKGSYLRQRMVTEGLSRAIMGTGIIAIGAVLAKMGILTGSNPDDDEDIYKLEKQYGLRDFSVNVSALFRHIMSGFTDSKAGELRKGDRIASYDWAEPIAMGLAVGADTELGSGEAIDFLSTVVRAVEAGTTTLAEQPLLTGLSNLFRYGDITQGMTQAVKSMPSSFTPTLFSHVAQFLDGRDTDPYTFYGTGQQAWNLVQNRIPGLRGNIPSRYSVLGDEKKYYPEDQNLVTRALNIFLNPSITSKYMPTNEAQMIFDLYEDSGNPDIVPRPPQKTYTIDKVKYTFTPESWEEMSKWLGKRYRDEIGYAMNTYMKSWSAEEQADEIEWIIKEVKNEAREKAVKLGKKVD